MKTVPVTRNNLCKKRLKPLYQNHTCLQSEIFLGIAGFLNISAGKIPTKRAVIMSEFSNTVVICFDTHPSWQSCV